jgi:hypothetical protein
MCNAQEVSLWWYNNAVLCGLLLYDMKSKILVYPCNEGNQKIPLSVKRLRGVSLKVISKATR